MTIADILHCKWKEFGLTLKPNLHLKLIEAHSSSLSMGSKSESSGGQVNCATSQSPLSFKSSRVTGRYIRGRGGDDDPLYNCSPLEYDNDFVFWGNEMEADNRVTINARDATPEKPLMTSVPISQQDEFPDTGAQLSLLPSVCVCNPLVEMVAQTPKPHRKERSSAITSTSTIPGVNLTYKVASYFSNGELLKLFQDIIYLMSGRQSPLCSVLCLLCCPAR